MNSDNQIHLFVNNVVCTFSVSHEVNLKYLAKTGLNVRHEPERRVAVISLKSPYRINCKVWESGKVVCTGAQSEDEARNAAAFVARMMRNLGFRVSMTRPRIANVMLTCSVPYRIDLETLMKIFGPTRVHYDLELHSAASVKMDTASMKVFGTGSLTVMAPNVDSGARAVKEFYESTSSVFASEVETID